MRVIVIVLTLLISACQTKGSLELQNKFSGPDNLNFGDFVNFESGQVRPLAISDNGEWLFAVNTPNATLEIFSILGNNIHHKHTVPVGLEPVALASYGSEVWVVNHLSDSISVVQTEGVPRVIQTLQVGDEPRDIVFANDKAFITTAFRGQSHPDFSSIQLQEPGIGRASVWVFNGSISESDTTPEKILTLFSDVPRALAVTPDEKWVYAAAFHSGNKTAAVQHSKANSAVSNPEESVDGVKRPGTPIIMKQVGTQWMDADGRLWSDAAYFNLPDYDVFKIDSSSLTINTQYSGVGTTLFNMAVNPKTGSLFVSNTDANNMARFEGGSHEWGSLRGNIAKNQITVISESGDQIANHLNPHIDFSVPMGQSVPVQDKMKSLSQPMEMVFKSDGSELYFVAMSSNRLVKVNPTELESDGYIPKAGQQITFPYGGPTGLVLNQDESNLFVMNRFTNSIHVVDIPTWKIIQAEAISSPEPEFIVAGRKFLYDAGISSSNGTTSCASCHIFGDLDHLAWDLGDPDKPTVKNKNKFVPFITQRASDSFHPLKGPMTTQTLRGMKGMGPLHWRGDRMGNDREMVRGKKESLEAAAFKEFNAAFVGLLGRETELDKKDMQLFTDFAMSIVPPPNPITHLDQTLTMHQRKGKTLFFDRPTTSTLTCNTCHEVSPKKGLFGTSGLSNGEGGRASQDFKIPHFRNLYTKVGMFGMSGLFADNKPMGDQIRGFGFSNDGSFDTLVTFFREPVFQITDEEASAIIDYLFASPSNLAPIVGQQVTVSANTKDYHRSRIELLVNRAEIRKPYSEMDLVISGVVENQPVKYLYISKGKIINARNEVFDLSEKINRLADEDALTLTAMPPGSGRRFLVEHSDTETLVANR